MGASLRVVGSARGAVIANIPARPKDAAWRCAQCRIGGNAAVKGAGESSGRGGRRAQPRDAGDFAQGIVGLMYAGHDLRAAQARGAPFLTAQRQSGRMLQAGSWSTT